MYSKRPPTLCYAVMVNSLCPPLLVVWQNISNLCPHMAWRMISKKSHCPQRALTDSDRPCIMNGMIVGNKPYVQLLKGGGHTLHWEGHGRLQRVLSDSDPLYDGWHCPTELDQFQTGISFNLLHGDARTYLEK